MKRSTKEFVKKLFTYEVNRPTVISSIDKNKDKNKDKDRDTRSDFLLEM